MSLDLALSLARSRPLIVPRGSSSISRMVAVMTDASLTFVGNNSYKSHPMVVLLTKNPDRNCLHCEMDAVRKACNYFTSKLGVRRTDLSKVDLSDFTMSIARVLYDGTPALAKPCEICQGMLDNFSINKVEWTE